MSTTFDQLNFELSQLCVQEEMKRSEHAIVKDKLQDTWKKQLKLRECIESLKSAIENATLEELFDEERRNAGQTPGMY
jgi:hypothetical protein